MSGEFVAALNLDTCKATLSRDRLTYVWPCGLFVASETDGLDPSVSILRRPAVLQAAHKVHHEHKGVRASLYMLGGRTPTGIETISAAHCSCDHEDEVSRV